MLLTDADPVTQASLTIIDPELPAVATTANLVIAGSGSLIRYAMEDAGAFILSRFQSYSGYPMGLGAVSVHNWAVQQTGSLGVNRARFSLSQVVAVDPNPAKVIVIRWLELKALEKIYRGAFRRFMATGKSKPGDSDRYGAKMEVWAADAKKAWAVIEANGMPTVNSPFFAPGAIRVPGTGTFTASNLTASGSGSGDPGTTYYVAVTWVTLPQYGGPLSPANGESAPSAVQSIAVPAGEYLNVSIATLNPPNGTMPQIGTSDGVFPSIAATNWNVYAGTSASTMYLQNSTPIPIATTSYHFSAVPLSSGNLMGVGQWSDYNQTAMRTIQVG